MHIKAVQKRPFCNMFNASNENASKTTEVVERLDSIIHIMPCCAIRCSLAQVSGSNLKL